MNDDTLWRDRFIIVNLVRIGGTAVVLLGLGIWYTDLLRPGGVAAVGLPLAIAGLVVSFWGPVFLARRWKRLDGR
jgi:protein-S-isoprenylcysteine O-methyltransferase Ste14